MKVNQFFYEQGSLNSQNWNLISKEKLKLLNKLSQKFPSLESLNCQINLGLATGANDVFIIDEVKKAELIRQDAKNEEIIKPILRGRDIQKYVYDFANLYIILSRNEINIEKEYPTLYQYFDSFGQKFKERGAKGRHWTNLRAASFYDDFKLEKIIWIELSDKGRFALCTEEICLLNSAYFLIPPKELEIKYLLGILNSKLIEFYLKSTANTSGVGTTRWINIYIKNFPIPVIPKTEQFAITEKVEQILSLKKADKEADTSSLEKEIDTLVFALYGLEAAEVDLINS